MAAALATVVVAGLAGCASLPEPGVPPSLTLEFRLTGVRVPADLYLPAGPPRGAVILAHGFGRPRTTMGGHAAALAAAGALAVTPDLPGGIDVERSGRGLAELVAALRQGGAWGAGVDRVVLVGFSAGALAALLAAAAPGVAGLVTLDPVDRPGSPGQAGLGLGVAASLTTETWLLRAAPSRCNAQGSAEPWVARLAARVADERIEGASHCDFESPSDGLCAWACGAPDPQRQARVREVLLAAVERWLPRAPRGSGGGG